MVRAIGVFTITLATLFGEHQRKRRLTATGHARLQRPERRSTPATWTLVRTGDADWLRRRRIIRGRIHDFFRSARLSVGEPMDAPAKNCLGFLSNSCIGVLWWGGVAGGMAQGRSSASGKQSRDCRRGRAKWTRSGYVLVRLVQSAGE